MRFLLLISAFWGFSVVYAAECKEPLSHKLNERLQLLLQKQLTQLQMATVEQVTLECVDWLNSKTISELTLVPKQNKYIFGKSRFLLRHKSGDLHIVAELKLQQKQDISLCDLTAGDELPQSCLQQGWQIVPRLTLNAPLFQPAIGDRLLKNVQRGQALTAEMIGAAGVLQAGQQVTLIYQRRGVRVEATAQLLRRGAPGQRVEARLGGQTQTILVRVGNDQKVYLDE
jgi:hypothetical protein